MGALDSTFAKKQLVAAQVVIASNANDLLEAWRVSHCPSGLIRIGYIAINGLLIEDPGCLVKLKPTRAIE